MFGKKNDGPKGPSNELRANYDRAKEAARRATFLKTASQTTEGQAIKHNMATLFDICHAQARKAGEAIGLSQTEIDADIKALFNADVGRLKSSSGAEFGRFTDESGRIVNAFVATLDPKDRNLATTFHRPN